jgi:hypothetical protein
LASCQLGDGPGHFFRHASVLCVFSPQYAQRIRSPRIRRAEPPHVPGHQSVE